MKKAFVDKPFLSIIVAFLIVGFFIFISAAFSFYPKSETQFLSVITNQILFGLVGGIAALYICSRIPYTFWKKYALPLFLGSVALVCLIFIPGVGFEHGGARRWILIGGFSFQPSEFLKIAFIIYAAAWFSWAKERIKDFSHGLLPLCITLGILGLILLLQPDTDTFMIIALSGIAMFFIAGGPLKHLGIVLGIGCIMAVALVIMRPYLFDRLKTFVDPSRDPLGSSYQVQQSLIAIGSGQAFGRGYGQSIQKFRYLPEPAGDSIFAVVGEEMGFLGCMVILFLYMVFLMRGLRIGQRAPDRFGGLLVTGIVILLVSQSFLNIASTLSLFPLSGTPLVFISHGGTALLTALAGVGIILNVSRYQKHEHA